MKSMRFGTAVALAAMLLQGCGGGGGGSGGGSNPIAGTPSPPPPPVSTACSLRDRQLWVQAQMQEWYLFPETLPASLDPAPYPTVQAYIDALTATARAQHRDRFFTFIASIKEDEAFFSSGATAGFGVRLSYDSAAQRLFVLETFEGTPALAAGIDRGTEIIAIGTSESNLQSVSSLFASGGAQAVSDALGPSTAGTTRVLRITDSAGTRNVTVAKADFDIPAVSSRYGAKVIDDGGRKVGYVNLRTFISQADPDLRNAFASFKAQGITEVIVDLRYNGGGLVSIAELMGDLMGGNRSPSDVFSFTTFRASKSNNNDMRNFAPQPQSIGATKIAFIGTGGTASASELVINSFIPYLHANAALIGTNTYGKPVGQIGIDRPACDDRLRVIAFATQNAAHQGNYFDGLATVVEASCKAGDDINRPLGDPSEASTRQALDFLAGRTCTRIASGAQTTEAVHAQRELLVPEQPTTAQREVPGTF